MLHLGIEELKYAVRFDSSCYYPISFTSEYKHTKILFGACFGFWWWNNSISISRRPSENRLDKMDLFAHTYSNGFKKEEYIGCIDIEKKAIIKLLFEKQNKIFRIQAFEFAGSAQIINHCTYYKYPLYPFGYTLKRTYGSKIVLERQ